MWYLQNIFISLFFVCAACNPADVASDSAADGGVINEFNIDNI